jgi:hypothetical protein
MWRGYAASAQPWMNQIARNDDGRPGIPAAESCSMIEMENSRQRFRRPSKRGVSHALPPRSPNRTPSPSAGRR